MARSRDPAGDRRLRQGRGHRSTAGELKIGPDRIVYVGDGSSDIHVMLHVNRRDGFTIAVSENKYLAPIAKRSVISDNALAI